MIGENFVVVETIHPWSNKFVRGVNIQATGVLKLNDRADQMYSLLWQVIILHTASGGMSQQALSFS